MRRTRLAQELPDRAASVAPRVAALLGAELGWDEIRRQIEVSTFLRQAHIDFDVRPPRATARREGGTACRRASGIGVRVERGLT